MMSRTLVFGRHESCDVVVDDAYASPRHCAITQKDGRFYVTDMGSTNGTWILRGKLGVTEFRAKGPTWLLTGDRVRIGRTILAWEA